MDIVLYNFCKEENSTEHPTQGVVIKNCILKEYTTIENPVIEIKETDMNRYSQYTYCRINDFNRYYFIDSMEFAYPLLRIYLICDVMASFRDLIIDKEEYVLRSEKLRDEIIADNSYPSKIDNLVNISEVYTREGKTNVFVKDATGGTYVIGVLNGEKSSSGVSYYAMTYTQFNIFREFMLSVQNYQNLNLQSIEISEDLLKVLYNPFQYISSITYFPIQISQIRTFSGSANIPLGWWSINYSATAGYKVKSNAIRNLYVGTIQLHAHPQAGNPDTIHSVTGAGIAPFDGMGQYLNYAPFTRTYLQFEPFGTIELDNQQLGTILSLYADNSLSDSFRIFELDIYLSFDIPTGIGYLSFDSDIASITMPTIQGQIGTPIQIAQATAQTERASVNAAGDFANMRASLVSSVLGGIESKSATGIITSMLTLTSTFKNACLSALETAAPQVASKGTTGNFASYYLPKYVKQEFSQLVDPAPNTFGYPLYKKVPLKYCKDGFVQCSTQKFTYEMINPATRKTLPTKDEQDKILNFMNNGFYLY